VISPLDEQVARLAELIRVQKGGSAAVVQRFGTADAWLLRRDSELIVLKRGRPEQDDADVVWEHSFLCRLSSTDIPASVPVPAFDGRSWTRLDGRIWATLTYIPGRPLVSEPAPDAEAAGSYLARFHGAARSVLVADQRPTSAPLAQLRRITSRDRVREALGSSGAFDRFDHLLTDLESGLHKLRYDALEQLVIHGDATNDNLIVDGTPSKIVGLIDFGSAHLAAWPFDLAAALWRSGRPTDSAIEYDLGRVSRFVAGYDRESPLPIHLARAVPLLMQGRGLQLISRQVRRLPPGLPTEPLPYTSLSLARASWIHDNRQDLIAAIDAALYGCAVSYTARDAADLA
jgi:Ser/Thr protein kinase RdoA (MazF antagonist)